MPILHEELGQHVRRLAYQTSKDKRIIVYAKMKGLIKEANEGKRIYRLLRQNVVCTDKSLGRMGTLDGGEMFESIDMRELSKDIGL